MLATGILFRRDRKGRYISHAKKLQGILMYSLKVDESEQFDQKKLSNWLADNYSFFGFDRNIPKKIKRYKILEEIDPLLELLINLGLINMTTNTGSVVLQYTIVGRLLALIIDSFDQERRLEDNRKIYEILKSHSSSNKHSKNQFFLALITVYHHQNNLDDLTEILRRVLVKVAYIPIIDLMDVYEIVEISYFADSVKAGLFLQNWNTALNNLEPTVRELLLYDIKLVYEARMVDNKDLGDPMLYEDYRFDLRGNAEETALQAKCIKCNIVLNLSDKTSKVVTRDFNRPLHIRCPECKNINCLIIPSL